MLYYLPAAAWIGMGMDTELAVQHEALAKHFEAEAVPKSRPRLMNIKNFSAISSLNAMFMAGMRMILKHIVKK